MSFTSNVISHREQFVSLSSGEMSTLCERQVMWMPALKNCVFKDPPKFKNSLLCDIIADRGSNFQTSLGP